MAPVFYISGEFAHVRTDLYAASSARLIAALGAGLITTFIAAGLFGSVAPATAQEGYGNVFGYDDHRAEELQQRYNPRTVRRSRAAALDDRNTADKKKKGSAVRHSRAPSDHGSCLRVHSSSW